MSYDAPRLFNNPNWRLTFTAFYDNTVDVTTFTSQRLEGSVQAEQTINKASIMTYRLTYRRVRANDIRMSVPTRFLCCPCPPGLPFPTSAIFATSATTIWKPPRETTPRWTAAWPTVILVRRLISAAMLIQNSTYYSIGRKRNSDQKFVLARSTRIGVEIPYGNTFMPQPGEDCTGRHKFACRWPSVFSRAAETRTAASD